MRKGRYHAFSPINALPIPMLSESSDSADPIKIASFKSMSPEWSRSAFCGLLETAMVITIELIAI